ncbi:MAG TPA: hypothetical protein VNM22_00985 [Candidatus Limnocylindrales bacterium]|nr:hypothetical protein [Candidatus Limnocylindrales bacterium]
MQWVKKWWKNFKDFFWGLFIFDLYRITLEEKVKYEEVMNIVLLGELLGIPLMNSTVTLRLLPYLFPKLKKWKQNQLRERDVTEFVPEVH